ncbi:LytR/AlgR family response regulator transcription factor [Neptunicella sp. SCSIO 80796]|uniref:LytR/AlgR family response regulator transcription factor n=1 Tax=Neptunicella plasticusilytica TaxID=3117012 RepID=UPI003A4D932C
MDRKIKTLIVDDEPLARRGLSVRLADFPQIQLLGECHNGNDAAAKIIELQPDLVFLDIQMPGMNGFQVINYLGEQGHPLPIIIFVTAFDSYAIKAFDVHALDYVLKPVDDKRLELAVDKVSEHFKLQSEEQQKYKLASLVADFTGDDCEDILRNLAEGKPINMSQYPDILAVKDGSEVTRVSIVNIKWIDAAGDYMCVHSTDGTHIMRSTMKELEDALDPRLFVRVHRSAIVNIRYVTKMVSHISGEYHLILSCGTELKVSRSNRDKVKSMVGV